MTTVKTKEFSNKVVLVTGGASGIGKRAAELFAQAGAAVAITDIDIDKSLEFGRNLQERFECPIKAYPLDVSDHGFVSDTVRQIYSDFGQIDIAINAAGIGAARPEDRTPADIWRRMISVNLDGVYYCALEEGAIMRKSGAGKIINFASISGTIVNRLPEEEVSESNLLVLPAYCAAKAGVIQLTKVLAAYWAKDGVRVNCISPGFVRTPMTDEIFAISSIYSNIIRDTPLQRVAEPQDLDGLLLYLASDTSAFMTGAELRIDGGYTLW